MDQELPPSTEYLRVSPRAGLLLILLVSIAAVSWAVVFIYHLVHYSLGMQIAEVVIAFLVILVLQLIFVGIRVGFSTKRVLRKRRDHAKRLYCLFERSRTFQEFWAYLGLEAQTEKQAVALQQLQTTSPVAPVESGRLDDQHTGQKQVATVPEEILWLPDLEEEITKRGRPPEHSIDRWARRITTLPTPKAAR